MPFKVKSSQPLNWLLLAVLKEIKLALTEFLLFLAKIRILFASSSMARTDKTYSVCAVIFWLKLAMTTAPRLSTGLIGVNLTCDLQLIMPPGSTTFC